MAQNTDQYHSRYYARLREILLSVDEGFGDADYMDKALLFFEDKWKARDQHFLKMLFHWADEVEATDLGFAELLAMAKFGASPDPVELSAIAGNLRISYGQAIFRTLSLAAFGLVVPGPVSRNGNATAIFSPPEVIRFVLKVRNMATFSDEEVNRLLTFFTPEIKARREERAISILKGAAAAAAWKDDASDNASDNMLLHEIRMILGMQGSLSAEDVAQNTGTSLHRATELIILLAIAEHPVVRVPPFFAGTSSIIVIDAGPSPVPKEVLKADIEIADLTTTEAKAMFAAANGEHVEIGDLPTEAAKDFFKRVEIEGSGFAPICPTHGTNMVPYDYSLAWVCETCIDENDLNDEDDYDWDDVRPASGTEMFHFPDLDGDEDSQDHLALNQSQRLLDLANADNSRAVHTTKKFDSIEKRLLSQEHDLVANMTTVSALVESLHTLRDDLADHMNHVNAHTKREIQRWRPDDEEPPRRG